MKCFLDLTALFKSFKSFKPFNALRQFKASRPFHVQGSMFNERQTRSTLARFKISQNVKMLQRKKAEA